MTTVSSASPALKENDPGNRLFGPLPDVQAVDGYEPDHPARVGFFTDTSVCIGCKACEVACKEWNTLPMDDSNGTLDALGLSEEFTCFSAPPAYDEATAEQIRELVTKGAAGMAAIIAA